MPTQTVEITMVDPSPPPLFDESIEAVLNTLSETSRRNLRHDADLNSLLEDMRSICAANPTEQQRLLACRKKIAIFSRTFGSYFDLAGVFVEVKSDWTGIFWGLLGLLFKIGSDHVPFLERAGDMIKAIAHGLPRYRELQDACGSQFGAAQHERLALFSYVYADIVQFCLELYCIFSNEPKGAKLRHRFSNLPATASLNSRFLHLQQHLARHRKWIEATLPTAVQNDDSLAQRQEEYLDFLNVQTEHRSGLEAESMGRRMRRIEKVKSWLSNCCSYQDTYEYRSRQRRPDSFQWFLETPKYCKWKNRPFSKSATDGTDVFEATWHDRILFVQAPSGYGKTFLSDRVIDDLGVEAENLDISDDPPTTGFFHFNAAHSYCTHPNDAFRAIASQLVHTHRHDRPMLDALSLLMRKNADQEKATSDDILAILSLIFRRHSTFLVLDGIDESSDIKLLLTTIPDLCRKSDARVILFSRPAIEIPREYQKWATDSPHTLILDQRQNAADIEAYLSENLNRLADQGYFGAGFDRSCLSHIAYRSSGMFLWASLLLKYLQSPNLSPDERRASLEQAHLLEGIESLYRLILVTLDRKSEQQKRVAADIFRWLALSIKRICTPKLQIALSITFGQTSTEDQHLPDLAESIPHLTCGLVEVTECSVLFTHKSVKEYLESAACQDSDFSLHDESLVHGHLAARCLTYLANDVPKRPLQRLQPYIRPVVSMPAPSSGMSIRTGSSRDSGYKSMSSASETEGIGHEATTLQTPAFDANTPFLRYAALCWPVHLTRALSSPAIRQPTTNSQTIDPFAYRPWLPALSQFLTERTAITMWVEASWRYSLPPNLSRLIPLLIEVKSHIPPASIEGRELRWVIHGLRQLSEALSELREDYGATLRENPSLIWQWNIQAATEGGFWPVWDDRRGCVHGAEA